MPRQTQTQATRNPARYQNTGQTGPQPVERNPARYQNTGQEGPQPVMYNSPRYQNPTGGGGGATPPTPAAPAPTAWDRNWGAMPSTGQQQPQQQPQQPAADYSWMDMSQPGASETFYGSQNWGAPSTSQEYWEGQSGKFATGPQQTNFTKDIYERAFDPAQLSYTEQMIGQDPGLDPYYDRAFDRSSAALEGRFGALGLTGSTAMGNSMSNSAADIFADQAKNEADFRLRAAGQADTSRMDRLGLGRDFGDSMDSNARDWSRLGLDYATEGARVARDVDDVRLRGTELQGRAAESAQRAREGRIESVYDRAFRSNQSDRDFYGGQMGDLYDSDEALLDKELEALLGPEYAKLNLSRQQKSDMLEGFGVAFDAKRAFSNK